MRAKYLAAAAVTLGMVGCADAPTGISSLASDSRLPTTASYPWIPSTPLPAFPGAEGFGAYTVHARGGVVRKVTNLNDSGPGSLRAAVGTGTGQPARYVVFDVGGIIELQSPIVVRSGNLYIAGQTAPGDGITLKGAQLSIQTSNVVVRHIRSRPGDGPEGEPFGSRDGIQIITHGGATQLRNIILDHVSASWGVDENMSVWPGAGRLIENVTIQWSIISEGLMNTQHPSAPHSMGILFGEGSRNLSFHHNLLAHNNQRNPRIKHDVLGVDVVNNMIYNYGTMASELGETAALPPNTVNYVKNYWMRGANSLPARREVRVKPMPASSGIYYEGNYGPHRPEPWIQAEERPLPPEWSISDVGEQFMSPTRFPTAPITEQPAEVAKALVLARAGAGVPRRDEVDARVVLGVVQGTGEIIDSQSQVGGWPNHPETHRPAGWDTDGDGMPDAWEIENGLDPNDPSDANQVRPNGYTNIEWYLHWLTTRTGSNARARS